MTEYAMVVEQASDGSWSAFVPDVPGVYASSETREGLEAEMREALRFYSDYLAESGEALPAPASSAGVVSV